MLKGMKRLFVLGVLLFALAAGALYSFGRGYNDTAQMPAAPPSSTSSAPSSTLEVEDNPAAAPTTTVPKNSAPPPKTSSSGPVMPPKTGSGTSSGSSGSASVPASSPQSPPQDCPAASSFSARFLCLLNQHRSANGRGSLNYDQKLNQAASGHSAWMRGVNTLSHTGANNSSFTERCAAAGTTCFAENIAQGFTSAEHLFTIWKHSAGHNANMLGPYSALGLGTAGSFATLVLR